VSDKPPLSGWDVVAVIGGLLMLAWAILVVLALTHFLLGWNWWLGP
jgi:hypothetical protein